MSANARIDSTSTDQSGNFNAQSMREIRKAQERDYGPDYVDPMQFRKPEYQVYVYSVVDPRPAGKKLRRALPPLVPELEIAELKPGERYALVTTISHPVNQPLMRDNGDRIIDTHDARRLAMDLVNPDNLSLDQDRKLDPTQLHSEGNDFGKLGVFWSLNNPPTEEEITKAIDRKEAFYRARLEQARVIETSDPKALDRYLSVTDRVAAEYFDEEFSWHKKRVKPEFCPNCGDSIRSGAKFHSSAALGGVICVLDWKSAVEAGVKTKDQVPDSKRWWAVANKETKSSRTGETAAS